MEPETSRWSNFLPSATGDDDDFGDFDDNNEYGYYKNNDVGDYEMMSDGKLYWCNQKEDVVGIACSTKISRTRETRSQHQKSCVLEVKKHLSMKLLVFISLCWQRLVL